MDALSARAGAWSDVVGGGLAPLAGRIHEQAENFGMVVPVSRENIEGRAPRQFAEFPAVTRDSQEGVGDDLVGKPRGLMMDVSQAGKCVQMESRAVHWPVEPSKSLRLFLPASPVSKKGSQDNSESRQIGWHLMWFFRFHFLGTCKTIVHGFCADTAGTSGGGNRAGGIAFYG